jgi:hypothetical protein
MPNVEIKFDFINKIQEEFYYCTKRNQNFNGSFGNGKSYGASMKAVTLLATYPYYRFGISRYSAKELNQSTMSTFFKICPPELYNESYGGRRNDREGYLRLINGSEVLWMHLDDYSDVDLRGKEFNSVLTDQGEEIAEEIYNILDARMERWDMAQIPPHLAHLPYPLNKFTGKPMPPCYNILLFNPETTLHWIYRRCHPDSVDVEKHNGPFQSSETFGEHSTAVYHRDAAWFTASMQDNPAIPDTLKANYLKRDQAWIDRFYFGKWGISGGNIHYVSDQSIIDFAKREVRFAALKLLEIIQKDGVKYRVMDHGEGAPTCCLWFAYLSSSVLYRNFGVKSKGIHICYREYYQPAKIIKYHREQIAYLSKDEKYHGNFADPQIFKKTTQKYGGFWTNADDYTDYIGYTDEERKKAPAISWQPADNNELSCRDAVSELLQCDQQSFNPITGLFGGPSLYFLKRHAVEYEYGCLMSIAQLQSAKRKKIDQINGEDIYSDERDPNVPDHAYDPIRYYAIMPKTQNLPETPIERPQFSFNRHLSNMKYRRHVSYGRR